MKHLLPLFLFLFLVNETKAQLKIDSNYTLLLGDAEYKNGSFVMYYNLDSLWIKEVASGKICRLIAAEWVASMQGSVYRKKSFAEVERDLPMKPKDKLFIDRIVLERGCFLPPKQIVIGIR